MKLITFKPEDYNKLSHLPFNRNFSVRQSLIESMTKLGFIAPLILIKTDLIDGKWRTYIADGQNRAISASFLNIVFYGVLLPNKFKSLSEIVTLVAKLNALQNPWNANNYAEAYNFLGYKEYNTLLTIKHKTPYTTPTVASLLYGVRTRGNVTAAIKEGKFKVNLLKETNYTLNCASKLSKIERLSGRMLSSLHNVTMLSSFDEVKFIKEYEKNAKVIKDMSLDDYTDIFTEWLK